MLRLTFGDTEVHVSTTTTLSRLLSATHRRYRDAPETGRFDRRSYRTIHVEIPPPYSAPELALREALSEIAVEIAAHHGWLAIRAVVVERDGRALVLVGAPGSGKSTLAAHLVSRGWHLLSDDVAFIDEQRSSIVAHQGLMAFRSGAMPHLPSSFRAALEESRWFVDEHGELSFYEVDPASVFGGDVWSVEAAFDAVIVIEDGTGARGVEPLSRDDLALFTIDGRPVTLSAAPGPSLGVVRKQPAGRMADHIERWCDVHAGG